MKEKPIIFSDLMVRAVLSGRKTQTRRVIKPQPFIEPGPDGEPTGLAWNGKPDMLPHALAEFSPYGNRGDRLWVRETWAYGTGPVDGSEPSRKNSIILYRADCDLDLTGVWKPSIHMPRWASRITLEVVDVRVEQIQNISKSDARSEGVLFSPILHSPVKQFAKLWDEINAKRGFSWDYNPWVWVVKFRRLA